MTHKPHSELWPLVLQGLADEPLVFSALGGMISYMTTLLIDRTLLTQGIALQMTSYIESPQASS